MRTLILLFALTLSCLAQPLSPNDPAFLQSTSPLRRGLIGYWRLEEASGTRYDCSSQGKHLTSVNSVSQGAGIQTQCAHFTSSSSQRLTAPSISDYNFDYANPFSVCFWLNLTNTTQFNDIYTPLGKFEGSGWYFIGQISTSFMALTLETSNGNWLSVSTSTYSTTNSWTLIAFTYDGSSTTNGMHLFLNNVETLTKVKDGTLGSLSNSSNLTIGDRWSGGKFPINGFMDEVGIWNRALTTTELTQLYNAGLGTHFPWAHP